MVGRSVTFLALLGFLAPSSLPLSRRPFGSSCYVMSVEGLERWRAHRRIQSGIALACYVLVQGRGYDKDLPTDESLGHGKLAHFLLNTHDVVSLLVRCRYR